MKFAKGYLAGILTGVLLASSIGFAASGYTLSVFDAKIVVNGAEKKLSDTPGMYYNGQTLVPGMLTYQGTTYVPLRFFSEAAELPVKYVSDTKVIYVGTVPETSDFVSMPSQYKAYFSEKLIWQDDASVTVSGKQYSNTYKAFVAVETGTAAFNLDGKRKAIKGLLGIGDGTTPKGVSVQFYGDGNLISEYKLNSGDLPQAFKLNVDGVKKLEVKIKTSELTSGNVCFMETMIK